MHYPLCRSAAVGLALAAMLLRALLPDGWMPSSAGVPFAICSVDAAQHGGKLPANRERSHAPCAFAAAAPLSPPANLTLVLDTLPQALRLVPVFFDARMRSTAVHRPNAARAPPALV